VDAVEAPPVYRFGHFRLDLARGALTRGDVPVPLNSRAFELLSTLVAHQGEIMAKDALLAAVWPGSVVEEGNLTVHMSALRRALGDTRDGQGHIVTIPGRGYRFVTPVSIEAADGPTTAPPRKPRRLAPMIGRDRRALIAAAAGILILIAGIAVWRGAVYSPSRIAPVTYSDVDPSGRDRRQTLFILPFDDESGNETPLASKMTYQVTDRLQSWVVGTSMTAAEFKAQKLSMPEIARRLDVHFVLTGRIEQQGEARYIHYTLIDAPSDQQVLNDRTRPLPADGASTRPILDQIAHNVQLGINRREVALAAGREPDARDWVIRAQAEYGAGAVNRVPILRSLDYLKQALALKPGYPLALRYDSRERVFAAIFHWLPDAEAELARAAAENQEMVLREPENSFFQYNKALILIGSGRIAEAMSAIELNYRPGAYGPGSSAAGGSVITTWMLGRLRAQSGRLEEAKALLEETDRNEDWDKIWDVQASLAAVDLALGLDDDAVSRARKAIAIAADAPTDTAQSWLVIASAEALRGDARAANAALASYRALPGPIPASATEFARALGPRFAEGLRKAGFEQ
jgi:DNA-binding winged helix-turn-helix (wHTH) protein/TolB-like protein